MTVLGILGSHIKKKKREKKRRACKDSKLATLKLEGNQTRALGKGAIKKERKQSYNIKGQIYCAGEVKLILV